MNGTQVDVTIGDQRPSRPTRRVRDQVKESLAVAVFTAGASAVGALLVTTLGVWGGQVR